MALITEKNREPIKRTAQRINRSTRHAILLCKAGKLVHQRDAAGRYWSSKPAADAFMGEVQNGPSVNEQREHWHRKALEYVGLTSSAPRGNGQART